MKPIRYIKQSFEKFKKDALSKLMYDILKWLIPLSIVFANAGWFSGDSNIFNFLFNVYPISLYWIILYSLLLIIAIILVVNLIFRKKYTRLQLDNFTDELTGLKNYKALKKHLNEALESLKTNNQTLSVILIDIDGFKGLNTKLGHDKADQIIKKLAESLNSDKRATDELYRYFLGGDEFLIIANKTNQHQAHQAAERKRKLIADTIIEVEGDFYELTVSCGVTEYKKGDDFSLLTTRVSKALSLAKEQEGKNSTKTLI